MQKPSFLSSLIVTVGRMLLKLIYRVEVKGLENFAKAGDRVVIIANHTSRIDMALLGCFLPERAMYSINIHDMDKWWAKAAAQFFDVLPYDPANAMAARAPVAEIKKGRKLIVFPEGRISVTGALMKIYETPGTIAHLADANILPVRIDGAQYSQFSKMHGILRRRLFPKITLTILPPVQFRPAKTLKGAALRNHIALTLHDIMTAMVFETSNIDTTLFETLQAARKGFGGKRKILEDIQRAPINYNRLIAGIFVLGKKLAAKSGNQKNVGVLLPNANACVVTFFGLQVFNKVPAMLNFSTGPVNMSAACTAAQIQTIITSRRFIEEGEMEEDLALLAKQAKIIFLEDVREEISGIEKIKGLLSAKFVGTATSLIGTTTAPDDPATILFTSGSEGVPKGVVLSHKNLMANLRQVATRIPVNSSDIMFNALPIFHALGLTMGTLMPLMHGIRTFLYPSPLHYKIVPELVYASDATILLGTNTFLAGYARNAHPYDFYNVWLCVGGAEKVRQDTRDVYMEKFGTRIIEGYGATECSPVLAANTPMHFKSGTVGRLFDGIEMRLDPVPGIDEGGELVVKGPNIMLGYLRADNPGIIEKPEDGWYATGDIVDIDEDGYITIIGRAKRFAKIAAEMISLTSLETYISEVFPDQEHAVVSVPDKKKGEKLVLVTADKSIDRRKLAAGLKTTAAVELMTPRIILHVDEIPVLRTGKVDYVTINKMARDQISE